MRSNSNWTRRIGLATGAGMVLLMAVAGCGNQQGDTATTGGGTVGTGTTAGATTSGGTTGGTATTGGGTAGAGAAGGTTGSR